jgi:DNA/RNA endonuclease YhcR with UshA esterase domain
MRPTAILLALFLVVTAACCEDKPVKPISPAEAAEKLNEKVTVEMLVKSTGGKTAHFLNSEEDYKSDKNFTVFIPDSSVEKFKKAKIDDPKDYYKGKTVQVTGTVTLYREKPQIKIDEPDQIKVIEKKDGEKKDGEKK